MPLVHISLLAGKSEAYRQAIFNSIYEAMRETFSVPEGDQFMTIQEHDASNFRYGADYAGIARSNNVLFIHISAMKTRSIEQKKALFRRLSELLGESPGVESGDVFINLIEGAKENWSLGHGEAQYA
jgi:phenylpyruvate tautomerase PptA (4-oxalocrotonate tautomerase family)